MEKSIVIKTNEKGCTTFDTKGFSAMEALGILRYQEKSIRFQIFEYNKKIHEEKKKAFDSAEQKQKVDESKKELKKTGYVIRETTITHVPANKKTAPKKKPAAKKKKK